MPLGIYQKTEEHKAKLASVLKPYRFVKGFAPWNKGTKGSESQDNEAYR